MRATRARVYEIIDGERDYQDMRWKGHQHSDAEWLVYINHYVTKGFAHVSTEVDNKNALACIRKIAGLAVAAMEQLGAPERAPAVTTNALPEPVKFIVECSLDGYSWLPSGILGLNGTVFANIYSANKAMNVLKSVDSDYLHRVSPTTKPLPDEQWKVQYQSQWGLKWTDNGSMGLYDAIFSTERDAKCAYEKLGCVGMVYRAERIR